MRTFGRLVRAEWTKVRSVRRWMVAAGAAVVLSVALSTWFASASSTDANDYPNYLDQFHFVHQPLTGDGAVVARVRSLAASQVWARAGLMVKQQAVSGSPYAAVLLTAGHGVQVESAFGTSTPGALDSAPAWLRLTRTGSVITADVSTDGVAWTPAGTATLDGLPTTVEIGLFVSSPTQAVIERQFGGTHRADVATLATATFDHVALTPGAGTWASEDVVTPPDLAYEPVLPGGMSESGGTFTVTGSGDIMYVVNGDDDVILQALAGILLGLIIVAVIAVLTISSEFRRHLIRTTFTAAPLRGRALLAKATAVAGVSFVVGLLAAAGCYALARPELARNGFAAPNYPVLPLTDPTVLRVIVGAGLLLALVAMLAVALGALLRRGAAAITLILVLLLLPTIFSSALPFDVALWINRATPVAGMAILNTRPTFSTAISPWPGLGVLAGYTAAALLLAVWRIRRRDA